MKNAALLVVVASLFLAPAYAVAQQGAFHRLPTDVLDVVPPSEWVQGDPGRMSVRPRECRELPIEQVRRRLVEIAAQEWAFFGFPVLDRLNGARFLPPGATSDPNRLVFERTTRRPRTLDARESARVAASIGGYWAVTPEGAGIVEEQNRAWNGRGGIGSRWRAPWSAAFVSWVMCEAGLGTNDRFRRAIAHRSYIDQAIRARDGQAPSSAYVAFDVGERTVTPGDLLCSGRRPRYRNIHERRRHMGTGASTHCDIVVAVDEVNERIFAIGGNVLRSVSLKVLPAEPADGGVRAVSTSSAPLFAHLQLRADPIESDALLRTPILSALACAVDVGGGEAAANGMLTNGAAFIDRPAFVVAELGVRPSAPEAFC